MPRPAEPSRSIGIPSLLTRTSVALIVMTVVAGFLIENYLLRENFARIEQLLYQDTAGMAANTLLLELAERPDMNSALEQTERWARRALPSATFVVTATNGDVLYASKSCEPVASKLNQFPWKAFTSSITPPFPLVISLPCAANIPFLSASPFRVKERDMVLLLYGSTGLTGFLASWQGLTVLSRYLLPAFLWLLLTLGAVYVLLRQLFLRYVNRAADDVTRFAQGDRTVRLRSVPIDDLNEIHTAFNRLADEESKRLADLSAEDEGRRRMLAELIHDLKTPLTAIEAAAERLSQVTDSDQRARYVGVIRSSLGIQNQYSTMLSQLGSLPLDSFGLERNPVPFDRVLRGLVEQLRPAAETAGLTLYYRAEPTPVVPLLAHEGLLQRAFQNVLSNALRYTPRGGSITIEHIATDTEQLVRVADTGCGIPESALPRVREAFYRGEASSEIKGSGLGLAIVDRIVGLHGGSVEIESTVGAGTTVTMRFPKEPAETLVTSQPVPLEGSNSPIRVNPIVTAGLVILSIFTSVAVTAVFADSSLLAVVVVALLIRGALLFRGSSDPLAFLKFPQSVELLAALVLLISFPGDWLTTTYLGFGYSMLTIFMLFTAVQRRDRFAALVSVIAMAFTPAISPTPKPFLVGALAGVIVVGIALIFELLLRGTRMVSLTLRSLLLLGVSSVTITAIGLFQFVPASMRIVGTQDAEHIASELQQFASTQPSAQQFAERIADITRLHPLFDIALFERSTGQRIGEAVIPKFPDRGIPGELLNGLEPGKPQLHYPSMANSRSLLQLSYLGTSLPGQVLAIQYPSWLADHLASRNFPYFMIYLSALVWLFIGVPASFLTLYTSRIVAGRVQRIREGIERYRNGNYSAPIALNTDDALGTLIEVIDDLARRLPQLTTQLLTETDTVKRFLMRCGEDLHLTTQTIALQLSEADASGRSQQLMQASAQQRHRLENLLELFQLRFVPTLKRSEPIPLPEILDEEISNAQERARHRGLGVSVLSEGLDRARSIAGNPEVCVEALRHLLDLAVATATTTEPPRITVRVDAAQTELQITIPNLELGRADLEFLDDPLRSPVGMGEPVLPLGGYRTVRLCRQFQALGWQISFESTGKHGCMARVTFRAALLWILSSALAAQPARALDLPLCTGYDPVAQSWEMSRVTPANPEISCPAGQAYMALGIASKSFRDSQPPRGSCCPLPPGALLEEHSYSENDCPPDTVMTGVRQLPQSNAGANLNGYIRSEIRCTKIDTTRFRLLPVAEVFQINTPRDIGRAAAGDRTVITSQMRLPVELRFGIGRASRVRWEGACVGYPWGAVAIGGRPDCERDQFRELRTVEGEAMTSRCAAVRDIYSPAASCVMPPAER